MVVSLLIAGSKLVCRNSFLVGEAVIQFIHIMFAKYVKHAGLRFVTEVGLVDQIFSINERNKREITLDNRSHYFYVSANKWD